jgi:serine/threonine protein phosphatase PrpC
MAAMKVNITSHNLPRGGSKSGDACMWRVNGETVIAALADGVGGARAGVEASHRIVETLVENYAARPRAWTPQRALNEFARAINEALYRESLARFDSPELVSTLSVAVLEGDRLYGLNVGDSRVYLSRGGRLEQLSRDHVDPDQCHVLRRAIGLGVELEPHCFETDIADGDLAVLCSDGVSNVIPSAEFAGQLLRRVSARVLVQHARERADERQLDDMSAVVIDVAKAGRLRAVQSLPLPIPESPKKGDTIDGYELVRPFAGNDRVWLAGKDDRLWTLKFAPLEARDDEDILARFIKEAWNAGRAAEAAPESFVAAFTPERATARYYVQEFIDAPSLKGVLKARALGPDEAVALGKMLCSASEKLLGLDLVHGDLKPENVLVISDYARLRFKLIDLGSAAALFSVTSRAGTASYLAPERFHGAPNSERTEIFAIGVTLYEALTRRFPFGEIERFQTPVFHAPKPPGTLNTSIPSWLDQVILRAMSIEPERRYQHFSELAFDLEHPDRVEPFFQKGAPLLERNPLAFYRAGFFLLLAACLYLLVRLVSSH